MRTDRERIETIKIGKANRKARDAARLAAFERDLLPVRKQSNWQLIRVDDIAWVQDRSGIYVVINWDVQTESARLDVMTEADAEPLQSFIGSADNVRKAVMRWFAGRISQKAGLGISLEHAAYIGAELERCDTERIDYVQD